MSTNRSPKPFTVRDPNYVERIKAAFGRQGFLRLLEGRIDEITPGRCVIVADFRTALACTGPWRRSHRAMEYGDPEQHEALLDRISPISRVDRVCIPLLVLHGTRDPRVPIGESEQFVSALRERQKPAEYIVFDYAGHGFIRPPDRQRAYAAVAAFFAKHL